MSRPLFLSALFACLLPLAARAQDSLPRFDWEMSDAQGSLLRDDAND